MAKRSLRRFLSFTFQPAPLWLALGLLAGLSAPVLAQETLKLSVRKNMGYNNGSQIQGSFRAEATGPADLAAVTFTLDGAPLGVVTAAPFKINFDTGDYAPGWHTLGAAGQTAGGQTLAAAAKRYEFLSAAQAGAGLQQIMLPLLAIAGGVIVLSLGAQLWAAATGKKNTLPLGAARRYGLWGGAICPKCQRPFAMHWWGLNTINRKFDRCDHCGQWSFVRAASREKLAEAEAGEAALAQPATPSAELSAAEKLKREIDASRFLEH